LAAGIAPIIDGLWTSLESGVSLSWQAMQILETSRLILREFVTEDVDALARVLSDPETMRFYPVPFDRAAVDQWIGRNMSRYTDHGFGLWAMILKSSDEVVGDCGITLQNVDGKDGMEIGYHVRRDLWGRGLATEAARACRDLGFSRFGAEHLISLIRPENTASCRVAEKNGMTIWKELMWHNLPHRVYAIHRGEIARSGERAGVTFSRCC
jgi:[ribosomal protein S5]-alanine N-acetyltransferase